MIFLIPLTESIVRRQFSCGAEHQKLAGRLRHIRMAFLGPRRLEKFASICQPGKGLSQQ